MIRVFSKKNFSKRDSETGHPLCREKLAVTVAVGLVSVVLMSGIMPQKAAAETLHQALKTAYLNNPSLRAERARQRATDEGVSQALSGWRPNVALSADAGRSRTSTSSSGASTQDPHGLSVSLTQPLFRGFRTINGTKQAEANVQAGRQALLSVEQSTLLDAVTAYMDVLRDQSVVKLQAKNVNVLSQQLKAEKARFRVGEVTRTDVAQSQASRAGSVSTLAQARANLASSRAVYGRVIGTRATALRYPPSIRKFLPRTLNRALDVGRASNPQLLAASYSEISARRAVKVIKGELYPELSLEATYSYRRDVSSVTNRSETATILGRLNIPLYQSGSVYSRVRQAKQSASQQRLLVLDAERTVVASVISSWEQLQALRAQIVSDRAQVKANTLALQGVRQEALVGSRTTLDVLDAEQELLNSNVTLVRSRRDEVVASYQLLSSIGRLTARSLKLRVKSYNPNTNYIRVRNKLFGTNIGESHYTK